MSNWFLTWRIVLSEDCTLVLKLIGATSFDIHMYLTLWIWLVQYIEYIDFADIVKKYQIL